MIDIALPLHNEHDLIEACIRNERWAQQRVYEEHYGKMMAVCMRYASSQDDALDMLHEGFLKVFKHMDKYQPGTALTAWIRRIMVNTCIDYYRRVMRRRTEDLDTAYHLADDSQVDAISKCSEQDILAAIRELTPIYRTVFNMFIIEGFSHKEISEHLGITESTSRANLVKARSKVKEILLKRSNNEYYEG